MQNIINLAAERTQRQSLAQQATESAQSFVAGLQHAGQTLANLARLLAAPVRHHDKELKDSIYALVLARLDRIITGVAGNLNHTPELRRHSIERVREVAFAAFQMQILPLAAAECEGKPAV